MRIRTIRDLEIHRGEPSTEAPVKGIIYEGFELEVEGPVEGEALDGNDLWYRIGEDYYWSGGAVEVARDKEVEGEVAGEGEGDRAGRPADIQFPAEAVDWNARIRWSGGTGSTTPQEWEATRGRGVKVAVLDSGIFAGHPDLAHLTADRMADFSGSDFGYEDRDVIGHGTQM
ncbi:MAG: hypothetical protein R3224_07195, partial [Balneolaceae bacterium]|nr:hypothetical protein [Balneolaceae bacterium]